MDLFWVAATLVLAVQIVVDIDVVDVDDETIGSYHCCYYCIITCWTFLSNLI